MNIKASELLDYWRTQKGYSSRIRDVTDEEERALRLLLFLRYLEDNAERYNLKFGDKEHLVDVCRAYGTPFFTPTMFLQHVTSIVKRLGMDPDAFDGYFKSISQSVFQDVAATFDLKAGVFDLERFPQSGQTIIWGIRRLGHADKIKGHISYYWDGLLCTRLLTELLGDRRGAKICDPLCGNGGFLAMVTEHPGKLEAPLFYGMDTYPPAIAHASMMLLFDGYDGPFDLVVGDALEDHAPFPDAPYDGIVCEPGVELFAKPRIMSLEGYPPGSNPSDVLGFMEREVGAIARVIELLADGGVAVILLSAKPGFSLVVGKLRRYLLERDLMDACIEIPKAMFDPRDDGQCLWVLRSGRSEGEGVLLVNVEGDGAKTALDPAGDNTVSGSSQNQGTLDVRAQRDKTIDWLLDVVANRRVVPFASMLVSRKAALATDDASLRYSTYASLIDMDAKMAEAAGIDELREKRARLLQQMNATEADWDAELGE